MSANALPTQPGLAEKLHNLRPALQRLAPRLRDFFTHVLGQARILKLAYPGLMHLLIFWGVTVQVLGTAINLMQMQLFIPFVELPFPRGNLYLAYELVMDLAGLAILAGVGMAAFRRAVLRPKTLQTRWDDVYALTLLGLIPIVGFSLESLRLYAAAPPWANWSPVGAWLSGLWPELGMTPAQASALHSYFFWTHAALGLGLLASIPFTKLRHLVTTPLNILTRPLRKAGALVKIEDIDNAEKLGVGEITDFTSHQLLSFDACVNCGRCEQVCPVTTCGSDYTPRNLIQTLRLAMNRQLVYPENGGHTAMLSEIIPEGSAWSCTTCAACLQRCPAFINPVDEIIDLRRYQALTTGKLPKPAADTLRNLERQGNPWGMPAEDRLAWTEGLELRELAPGDETDVLLFLGCAFAYDERNQKVARSFVRLLQKAGVDFGILGYDEACCGDTARRLGHEYLFQMLAEQNIQALNQVKFQRIVTQCPHCYNTLKNEYPQMGGHFTVQHYTEFLAGLELPWNFITPNGHGVKGAVAYHDSCYLGRYNQVYQAPRRLLDGAQVQRVEMEQHLENSFCCGGGGGQMWLETETETRINHARLSEALQVQAQTVATACPYCLLMFDDAIRSKGLGEKIQILDVAEILEKQLAEG